MMRLGIYEQEVGDSVVVTDNFNRAVDGVNAANRMTFDAQFFRLVNQQDGGKVVSLNLAKQHHFEGSKTAPQTITSTSANAPDVVTLTQDRDDYSITSGTADANPAIYGNSSGNITFAESARDRWYWVMFSGTFGFTLTTTSGAANMEAGVRLCYGNPASAKRWPATGTGNNIVGAQKFVGVVPFTITGAGDFPFATTDRTANTPVKPVMLEGSIFVTGTSTGGAARSNLFVGAYIANQDPGSTLTIDNVHLHILELNPYRR